MLREIFAMQKELNKRYSFDPPGGLLYAGRWLNNFIDAALAELIELRDCTFWKHWYREAREGRRFELHSPEKAKEEVIDLLHFWVSMAQAVGLTADEVLDTYKRKNAKNHNRRDDNVSTTEAKNAKYHVKETPPCEECARYDEHEIGQCTGSERLPGQDCTDFIPIANSDEFLINQFLLIEQKLGGKDTNELLPKLFQKIPFKYKVSVCLGCGQISESCDCPAGLRAWRLRADWRKILNDADY